MGLRMLAAAAVVLVTGGMANAAWINELHYDNASSDTGEFVEIVLAPGESIGDFSVVLYNGNGGASYGTISSFDPGATESGFQTFSALFSGIQNGAPDGLALVSGGSVVSSGGVVQFLSYEGSFTGSGDAADGLTSTDIGVSEDGGTSAGESLQLQGTGGNYNDFSWTVTAIAETPGAVNTGQSLVPEPSCLALLGLASTALIAARRRRRKA